MQRREFLGKSLLVAAGGTLLARIDAAESKPASHPAGEVSAPVSARVKLGMRLPPRLNEKALTHLRQSNLGWCRLDLNPEDATEDFLRETVDRYAKGGVKVAAATCRFERAEQDAFLPEAFSRRISREQHFIRLLGQLGVANYEIAFNRHTPNSQVYSTGTRTRRGIEVRHFDLAELRKTEGKPVHTYPADQVTRAFDSYMNQLLPVAEQAGVRIALHPDDPPIAEIGGVARIFHHIEHYKAAFKRHPSPNLGVLFCVGTWAEGGDAMGAGISEAIEYFHAQKRLFSIHFRNVSAPLPVFEETFMDDGYVDLQAVMNTLVRIGYDGLLVPDHIPFFDLEADQSVVTAAGRYETPFRAAGIAYSAGAMNVYLQNALRVSK